MRTISLSILLVALAAGPASAAGGKAPSPPVTSLVHTEPRCPLPLSECLEAYAHMRERPWLGVMVDTDSSGRRVVVSVHPGGPADRAGVKPGDVLRSIGGQAPATWFAGRAGWKFGESTPLEVERGNREVALALPCTVIPEDLLAQFLGAHVLAGHLAYGDNGARGPEPH